MDKLIARALSYIQVEDMAKFLDHIRAKQPLSSKTQRDQHKTDKRNYNGGRTKGRKERELRGPKYSLLVKEGTKRKGRRKRKTGARRKRPKHHKWKRLLIKGSNQHDNGGICKWRMHEIGKKTTLKSHPYCKQAINKLTKMIASNRFH
ncbi:hypothetical protein CR513_07582, partial [Mucuna pruriens]